MKIRDLLATKGDAVEAIGADATIARRGDEAHPARHRRPRRHRPDGVRRRDHLGARRRPGAGRPRRRALHRRVGDEMSTPVTTGAPDDEVTSLMSLMTERRIRHLPVVEAGRLVGIVSIGDVVKSRVDQLERDRKELLEYVSAR